MAHLTDEDGVKYHFDPYHRHQSTDFGRLSTAARSYFLAGFRAGQANPADLIASVAQWLGTYDIQITKGQLVDALRRIKTVPMDMLTTPTALKAVEEARGFGRLTHQQIQALNLLKSHVEACDGVLTRQELIIESLLTHLRVDASICKKDGIFNADLVEAEVALEARGQAFERDLDVD